VPIYLQVDGDVFSVDLTGTDRFSGVLDVGGTVTDAIYANGLADGSRIVAEGSSSQPLVIVGDGPFADNVTIDVLGTLGSLEIAGGWAGGLLQADQVDEITVTAGDFGPTVDIAGGFGTVDVVGGNFTSPVFESGCVEAIGTGNDSSCVGGEAIRAAAVGSVGGSIFGNIAIAGSLEQLTASGGSIDATVDVSGAVDLVQASVDETTGVGGSIAGNLQFDSLTQVVSLGGTVTASLTTLDPDGIPVQVDAVRYRGYGGVIESPNSFHFAGGVKRISGNQINLRVEAGGMIESIVAVEEPGTRAMLKGRFTGGSFGEVRIAGDGDADFTLTTTDEAWALDGNPAFELIDLPNPDALDDMLRLELGTRPGKIRIAGEPIDYLDGDGIVPGTGKRLEALWEGFRFNVYVVPSSWQNYGRPLDVNDDGYMTPLDVLTAALHLNREGARVLELPSVMGAVPPDYIDTNGDGLLSPIDVLNVVTGLTQGSGESATAEAEPSGEPAFEEMAGRPSWPNPPLPEHAVRRGNRPSRPSPVLSQSRWHDHVLARVGDEVPIGHGREVELDWTERSFQSPDSVEDEALLAWLEEEEFELR